MKKFNKKTQAYGEVQQEIDITLEYSVTTRKNGVSTDVKVKKTAWLGSGTYDSGGFSFEKLLKFQEAGNQLLALTKSLLSMGTYVEFTLTASAYEHVPEHDVQPSVGPAIKSTLQNLSFDCWTFRGSILDGDPDDEESGLYLPPDTQYTEEHRDIFIPWNLDILKALAEAGL